MKKIVAFFASIFAFVLLGNMAENLKSSVLFEADYRKGKTDAVYAAGSAKGQIINGDLDISAKGLAVGKGKASIRYTSAKNLNKGTGAVEVLFENTTYDWDSSVKNMLVQSNSKELTFYIYKHSHDGVGAFIANHNPKWSVFPRQIPKKLEGRKLTHLVFNYSPENVQVYVDGKLARTIKAKSELGNFGKYFTVGPAGTRFACDEVSTVARVVTYNRPLSKAEVVYLKDGGSLAAAPAATPQVVAPAPANQVVKTVTRPAPAVTAVASGTPDTLKPFVLFEADYRNGKTDAVYAAGSAKGQSVDGDPELSEKGLAVGEGKSSIRYTSSKNLNKGTGAVEVLFENTTYDWNSPVKNMLVQSNSKELTFYIYKHSNDGVGAFIANHNPKWSAFPRQIPKKLEGRKLTHLVFNYSPENVQVYVDGKLARTIKAKSEMGNFGKYFTVGPAGRFACDEVSTIARVVTYNRPLSKAEVVYLNDIHKGNKAEAVVAPLPPPPVPVAVSAPAAAPRAAAPVKEFDFAAKFGSGKDAYKLLVFSDWHYDRMKFHTPDPDREWVMTQAERYSSLWDKFSIDVMEAAAKLDSEFVIGCGDNLEGYFNSPESQSEALKELDALVKKHLKRDWVMVVGNHEYAPADNRDAYFETAHELGLGPDARSFYARYGKDLYIFWDDISAKLDFIREALQSNRDARYVFVVTHLPVLPLSGRWTAFGYDAKDNRRKELLDLLCERNAVVLCGHVHLFSHSEYTGEKGKFSQVTVNSTIDNFSWKTPSQKELDSEYPFVLPVNYNRVKDENSMRSFLNEFQGKVSGVEVYNAVGYGHLNISDSGISMDVYSCTESQPFATWKLR